MCNNKKVLHLHNSIRTHAQCSCILLSLVVLLFIYHIAIVPTLEIDLNLLPAPFIKKLNNELIYSDQSFNYGKHTRISRIYIEINSLLYLYSTSILYLMYITDVLFEAIFFL